VPVPTYQKFWVDKRVSIKTACIGLSATHPVAVASMHQLFQVLSYIEDIANITPASVGESKEWAAIVSSAEENHKIYCQALHGKLLFSAMYGTYTVTLNELKSVLKKAGGQAGQTKQADNFKEVRNRKRHSTAEAARSPKKAAMPTPAEQVTTQMDTTDASVAESSIEEASVPSKAARPPPVILTSAANLIQL
jgi:hypothetical protein